MSEGKAAWLTGAGSNIGVAIATALSSNGVGMAISARTEADVRTVAASTREATWLQPPAAA